MADPGTVVVRIEHPVPDYELWKHEAFDRDPLGRERRGVRRHRVLRQGDGPSLVAVELEFADRAAAESFASALHEMWGRVRDRFEWREMRFLSWGEVDQVATNTIEPYGDLVRLAALTGLRQGELFGLRDRNVDLAARTLTVEAGVYAGQLVPVKTRAARRRVDLAEAATSALRAQLAARPPNSLGLVFPSPKGEILNDDNFRHRVFAPAVRRSGIGPVRFHDLRHTYATLMVAAGAHAKYLQAQMGHASIRVTLDLYGHLYPDANRTVLRELDRLIDPPGLEH